MAHSRWVQFSLVQLLSRVWLFETLWTAARQASLFITNSWSWCKLISLDSVIPPNHLILCFPLLLFSSVSFHYSLEKAFLSLAILWNSALSWVYLWLSPLLFASLLSSAICKASSDNHFAFLQRKFLFLWEGFVRCLLYNITNLCA